MFKIDGVDFSDYINKSGIIETPRRVTGPNGGTTLDGTHIEDLLTIKYDVEFIIKPLRPEQMKVLISALSKQYVALTYTSGARNADVTIAAVPSPSSIELLTYYAGRSVYGNATVEFMER